MLIVVNGFFWAKPAVGSGQYLHQLARWLPQQPDVSRVVLLLPALHTYTVPVPAGCIALPLATPLDRLARGGGRLGRLATGLAKLWFEQRAVPLAARLLRADLLHVPYFAPPLRSTVPVVATIHDLVPLLLPEYRGGPLVQAYMRLVRVAARRAAALLADSEATRRDLLLHLAVPPSLVTVVPLAAAAHYQPLDRCEAAAALSRLNLHPPFVYYVGGFDARKNLATLLDAFALARAHMPTLRLVLAGRVPTPAPPLFPDLRAQVAALGLEDAVVLPGFVSDAESRALYSACAAFAYPSRYEGFGLPPLEALACGAPVICAASSSLPEVVGAAARLVPVGAAAAWAEALLAVASDPALQAQMRRAGKAQAAQFSEQRTAAETTAVFRRVVQQAAHAQ